MPETTPAEAGGQRFTATEQRTRFLDLLRFMGDDGPEVTAMLDALLEASRREASRQTTAARPTPPFDLRAAATELGLVATDDTLTLLSRIYWNGFDDGRADAYADLREYIDEVR